MVNKPITTWYYEYYEPGAFPHQRELCEKVEWTKCNLEGRRLINHDTLAGEPANPLTIRLFNIHNKIKQLNEIVETISSEITGHTGIYVSQVTSSSTGIHTAGAPTERIVRDDDTKPIETYTVDLHVLLYELFANFGSVLDRLSFEINLFYNLGVLRNVSLSKILDDRPSHDTPLKTFLSKDTELADLLMNSYPLFKQAIGYRNRLLHDGIIRIRTDISIKGYKVMLAQNPKDDKSPMDIDAIEFCKEAKYNLLKLVDRSYNLMIQRIHTHGNPPW